VPYRGSIKSNDDLLQLRLGELLTRAREMRGISQEGLGRKVGRTQSFISDCEHAGTHLLVADFLRICHALDVSPYVILRRALTGRPVTRSQDSSPTEGPTPPGKHISDQQAKLYVNLRRTHSRKDATAKAGFSISTGASLDADPRMPSQKRVPHRRRRPDPFAKYWDSEIVPMLRASPGVRPINVLVEMQRRHADFPSNLGRTIERRMRRWQTLRGSEPEVISR
jgi:transcriptional regulator with XRE-family HTH domain